MLAPIGTQVQLRCSVVQEYSVMIWIVTRPGGAAISSLEPGVLESIGFIPTSITTQESVLTVNGTENNNGTNIRCQAVLLTDYLMRCASEDVQVIFYGMIYHTLIIISYVYTIGPPTLQPSLAATGNGVGSLNISWSLVTIEGVEVTFTVTVTNLNDSSTGPMEVSGIQDQHYIFTLEDSTSCDVYSFQVIAMNGAGTGTPIEIITRSLPSLPDISPVQDSRQDSN